MKKDANQRKAEVDQEEGGGEVEEICRESQEVQAKVSVVKVERRGQNWCSENSLASLGSPALLLLPMVNIELMIESIEYDFMINIFRKIVEIILLYILLALFLFVFLPFLFRYTPWLQRNMVFLPYVK